MLPMGATNVESDILRAHKPLSYFREKERPSWTANGSLFRRRNTTRHYVPKHPFYYTSNELYDYNLPTKPTKTHDTMKYASEHKTEEPYRRAYSAPIRRKTSRIPSQEEDIDNIRAETIKRPKTSQNNLRRSRYLRPEATEWLGTPVPGLRIIQDFDHYRRDALDHKNTILYPIRSGLLPKYMGYVPGFKFRYGSTFGMLTYNAKEVGIEHSPTWGGSVSLF